MRTTKTSDGLSVITRRDKMLRPSTMCEKAYIPFLTEFLTKHTSLLPTTVITCTMHKLSVVRTPTSMRLSCNIRAS